MNVIDISCQSIAYFEMEFVSETSNVKKAIFGVTNYYPRIHNYFQIQTFKDDSFRPLKNLISKVPIFAWFLERPNSGLNPKLRTLK